MPTSAREIRIEVQASLHRRSWWWFFRVSGQQVEDVIASPMSRLDNQAQIGRQGPIVGCSGRLVVLVRWRHVIAEFAGTLFNFALVVGLGVEFLFFGYGFHLVDGVGLADEGSVGDTTEGVAGGTDFAVNLEATAEAGWCQNELMSVGERALYAW